MKETLTEKERHLMFNTWAGKDGNLLLNEIINEDAYKERVMFELLQVVWENALDLKLKILREDIIKEGIQYD